MIDCEAANDFRNQDDNDSGFNSDEESTPDTNTLRNRQKSCLTELPKYNRRRDNKNYPLREIQVWAPNNPRYDTKIDNYLQEAESQYRFNTEQALALLYFNKYSICQSKNDLKRYTTLPHQWHKDKKMFVEALVQVGKRFNVIQTKFFPHKSVKELVEYYYMWKMDQKKKRQKKSIQTPR